MRDFNSDKKWRYGDVMTHVDRRSLMAAASSGALLGALPAIAAPIRRPFPNDFRWGCATASYQIEGAAAEDGKGPSIWDAFAHTPGKIKGGTTGDVACDSYHRYAEDTQLLKGVGANAYRLSFAWPRIVPEGRGAANQKGIDHYQRVVETLLENGIEPHVTLYHWDLPAALAGGWQSRDTAKAFADYAGLVAHHFSDRVKHFATLNEIRSFIDLGHGTGIHAPGLRLAAPELNQARHHALLAHGLGVQSIRATAKPGTQVGLAENVVFGVPAIEIGSHIEAAIAATRVLNAAHIVPILDGAYPDSHLAGPAAPRIETGDMKAIGSPVDFVGANVYTALTVVPSDGPAEFSVVSGGADYPNMGLPWLRFLPESTYWAARLLSEIWDTKAIYISENGTVAADHLIAGKVGDAERVMYLRSYLANVQRACAEGLPVKGYFLWSLLDNFEWAEGFTARFGIHYTNFATQQRTPKLSALWYKQVLRGNALV